MNIKTTSLSEQIADHLGQKIIRGELEPGARLPEGELAQSLDVSTNSLREAFRLLQNRYLVDWLPRRGARVRDISEEEVRELYDFLFLLLEQLAARVASNIDESEFNRLLGTLGELQQWHQAGNIAQAHQLVFEFIPTTFPFARNQYLTTTISDLLPQLQRYSYIALTEETTEFDASLDIFQRLFSHLMTRDAAAAASTLREYGQKQSEVVLRALKKRQAA